MIATFRLTLSCASNHVFSYFTSPRRVQSMGIITLAGEFITAKGYAVTSITAVEPSSIVEMCVAIEKHN